MEPVHTTSPLFVGATSYGLPQAFDSRYSFMRSVAGSNMPIELAAYSANHKRPWSSNRPRRGRVRWLGVAVSLIQILLSTFMWVGVTMLVCVVMSSHSLFSG